MVRHETQVWNRTDAGIEVKEGNGGIFNLCTPLERNAKHKVRIESDTTYRTFKVLRMGDPMNNVDLDSDYLTDNKLVYIRVDEHGKCYKDGILRATRAVTKDIVNNTGETIAVKETANLGDQVGRLTLLRELRSGDSCKVDAIDPLNNRRVLRYSVEIAGRSGSPSSRREITAEDFNSSVVEISMAPNSEEKKLVVGQRIQEPSPVKSFRRSLWPNWFK
jgi:hypothetical protein